MSHPYERMTDEDKIEAGEAAKRVVNSPDWNRSLGPWIEYRVELLRRRIDTMPIDSELDRKDFHMNRQELLVWLTLLKKPSELLQQAERLLQQKEKRGTQAEVVNG